MGCRWQTVEDGPPRDGVALLLKHEGHITEHVLVAVPVRLVSWREPMQTHLVIRAWRADGEITAAWMMFPA